MAAVAGPALLLETVAAQKRGEARGVYSICSSNRFVLEACMTQALADDCGILIESTCNQVNQLGGYSGATPEQFAAVVARLAEGRGLPLDRVVLGGDHLGPFPWQGEPAAAAMEKARVMVEAYVLAGYTKIHLDASMRCADDPPGALEAAAITARAAELCAGAESAHARLPPGSPAPVYVVGTEVPVPGGEQEVETGVAVTRVEDAEATIGQTREAFAARGLHGAWERVIAFVVQPGVEFGDDTVHAYDRAAAAALSRAIRPHERLVYEAHSTDYQAAAALGELVEDHFAILKVGPWLTFAFREAVFALAEIEEEWLGGRAGVTTSDLRRVADAAMVAHPEHWRKYYRGSEDELRIARQFSYSDRIRYYWTQPAVEAALERLLANLRERLAPLCLVSQYLPLQYDALRGGTLRNDPGDLIRAKVLGVADLYARACGMRP
jgi:D-tagatose-1,6-bisphosphate aldolase subunit GatZ/KbaZ